MEFFESLDPLLRTFWYIAIPVSFIFVFQVLMTFAGSDAYEGLSADFDGNLEADFDTPMQLFSFRNLTNFLIGFSWTGISLYESIANSYVLIGVALAVGLAFVYVFFAVIRQVQKLAEDNSFKINSTVNRMADVYLTIPGKMHGKGKVMLSVKGSVRELDAMTEGESLESGRTVKVVRIESENIVIVEAL